MIFVSIFCINFDFTEYIVSFNGYYKFMARKRFIDAALYDSGVISWKILPRDNPAHEYPSDFDVVKVCNIFFFNFSFYSIFFC